MAYAARFSLLNPQNGRPRTCLAQKSTEMKRPVTKHLAMKRPDKFDYLPHKWIKKWSILIPYLSAYGICANIILAHIAYALK